MSSSITDFFDKIAENRNSLIAENIIVEYEQEKRSEGIISFLNPQIGELILDVGCGNARDCIHILKKGGRIIGVDLSSRMIDEARRELENHFLGWFELRVGDATNLEFSDAYFDKVIASEVIEHIPDWKKSLSEMLRVLKPNGELIISTPNKRSWYGFDRYIIYEKILRRQWEHPYDQWKTCHELEHALTDCGFAIAAKRGICYIPGFIIPYFVLPRFLQKTLIFFVQKIEDILATLLPANGYMLCIKAVKN